MSEARRADGFLARREAGVLLHPTSLPSGSIAEAGRFLEFLARADCRVSQMLPLGPTGFQLSPYSPVSVFAGNVRLLPLTGGGVAPSVTPMSQNSSKPSVTGCRTTRCSSL